MFVVFNMLLGGLLYPARVFASEDSDGGTVLGDCAFLHLFTLTMMAGMWLCFILCYTTDPGGIDRKSKVRCRWIRGINSSFCPTN